MCNCVFGRAKVFSPGIFSLFLGYCDAARHLETRRRGKLSLQSTKAELHIDEGASVGMSSDVVGFILFDTNFRSCVNYLMFSGSDPC